MISLSHEYILINNQIELDMMKNNRIYLTKIYPYLIIIAIGFFLCVTIRIVTKIKHSSEPPKEHKTYTRNTLATNFDIFLYNKNNKAIRGKLSVSGRWLGWQSSKVLFFKTPLLKKLAIREITLKFYNNDETTNTFISVLKADNATIHSTSSLEDVLASIDSSKIDFAGNISLETHDKRLLQCDNLSISTFNIKNDEPIPILAKGNCVLKYNQHIVTGNIIKTDITLQSWKMESD